METTDLEYEIYLARKLGRTVNELRATLTPREFNEQYIYDQRVWARQEREADRARSRRR